MDKYREKIKVRKNVLSLVALGTLLIYLGLLFYRDRLPELPSFINGFHAGSAMGIELAMLTFIFKYMKAMKDGVALKKLYIKENDERTSLILQSASTYTIVIAFVGLGVAAIVAGFFNSLVFFTLLAALLFVMVVFYTLLIVYSKKI